MKKQFFDINVDCTVAGLELELSLSESDKSRVRMSRVGTARYITADSPTNKPVRVKIAYLRPRRVLRRKWKIRKG